MPVTPQFSVDQNDEFVIVSVRVPYVRVSNAEIDIDGPFLSFWCKPYLLKLTFPHELIDDDRARAAYDPSKDSGTVIIYAPKKQKGQQFPDLDLVTRLLTPSAPLPEPSVSSRLVDDAEIVSLSMPETKESVDKQPALITELTSDERPSKTSKYIDKDTGAKLLTEQLVKLGVSEPEAAGAAVQLASAGVVPSVELGIDLPAERESPKVEVLDDKDSKSNSTLVLSKRATPEPKLSGPGMKAKSTDSSLLELENSFKNVNINSIPAPRKGAALIEEVTPGAHADKAGRKTDTKKAASAGKPVMRKKDTGAIGGPSSLLSPAPPVLASARATASSSMMVETKPTYGFNRSFSDFFRDIRGELLPGVLDPVLIAANPDELPTAFIPLLRTVSEIVAFDPYRFIGDMEELYDDYVYQAAVSFTPWWMDSLASRSMLDAAVLDGQATTSASTNQESLEWTPKERSDLMSLPNKRYVIDGHSIGGVLYSASEKSEEEVEGQGGQVLNPESHSIPITLEKPSHSEHDQGLVHSQGDLGFPFDRAMTNPGEFPEFYRAIACVLSLLIAYTYDHRKTAGEPDSESAWQISTLSPLLSWLDDSFGWISPGDFHAAGHTVQEDLVARKTTKVKPSKPKQGDKKDTADDSDIKFPKPLCSCARPYEQGYLCEKCCPQCNLSRFLKTYAVQTMDCDMKYMDAVSDASGSTAETDASMDKVQNKTFSQLDPPVLRALGHTNMFRKPLLTPSQSSKVPKELPLSVSLGMLRAIAGKSSVESLELMDSPEEMQIILQALLQRAAESLQIDMEGLEAMSYPPADTNTRGQKQEKCESLPADAYVCKHSGLAKAPFIHPHCLMAVESTMRRALIYPYLRSTDLALLAATDATSILFSGRKAVLRALLSVRRILASDVGSAASDSKDKIYTNDVEGRYLLNILYVNDFCVFVQSVPDHVWANIGLAMNGLIAMYNNRQLYDSEDEDGDEDEDDHVLDSWFLSRPAFDSLRLRTYIKRASAGKDLLESDESESEEEDSDDDSDEYTDESDDDSDECIDDEDNSDEDDSDEDDSDEDDSDEDDSDEDDSDEDDSDEDDSDEDDSDEDDSDDDSDEDDSDEDDSDDDSDEEDEPDDSDEDDSDK